MWGQQPIDLTCMLMGGLDMRCARNELEKIRVLHKYICWLATAPTRVQQVFNF